MSADATHRFQPFQPSSELVEKLINQTNRKRFFANRTRKNPTNLTNQKRLIPIEHDLSVILICNDGNQNNGLKKPTANKWLWPRLVKMKTVCNLKKSGAFFQVFAFCLAKTIISWFYFILLSRIHIISSWSVRKPFCR